MARSPPEPPQLQEGNFGRPQPRLAGGDRGQEGQASERGGWFSGAFSKPPATTTHCMFCKGQHSRAVCQILVKNCIRERNMANLRFKVIKHTVCTTTETAASAERQGENAISADSVFA